MNLSGLKKLLRSRTRGSALKITATTKKVMKGTKCMAASQLIFFLGLVIVCTYKYNRGPYVKATNGKAYISITRELIRAKISSIQIRKSQAAINLFAAVNGFFVEISNPAKNDCEIPI